MLANYARWLRAVWQHPGNRSHRLRAVLGAVHWFVWHRITTRPLIVRVFGGLKFACYRDSYMGKHVRYFSDYADYDALHFLHDYLRADDSVIDVGANAGLYTLLAASLVGTAGRVLAVEPQPRSLEILRHNLALNKLPQVTVLPVAASDADGWVSMTEHDVFAGIAFNTEPQTQPSTQPSAQPQVPACRLDQHLGTALHALCKIDIEGYEWPALQGMEQAIQRGQLPVILFEMNGCLERYGMSPRDFYAWLRERSYTLANYHHDARNMVFAEQPVGDVFAINATGMTMIRERMAGLRIPGDEQRLAHEMSNGL